MFTVNSFFQKKLKNLAFSLESCVYVDSGGVFSTRDTQLSIIIYRSRGHNDRFMGFSLPDAFLGRYGRPWRRANCWPAIVLTGRSGHLDAYCWYN